MTEQSDETYDLHKYNWTHKDSRVLPDRSNVAMKQMN